MMASDPALEKAGKSPDPDPAPPKITYQWEAFHRIASELRILLPLHWREIGLNHDIPLAPDWERYFQFEIAGMFKVATVRADGRLVGYSTWTVLPHLHYSTTLWAHNDVMWLDPIYRQGYVGVRMLRFALKGLKEMGVRMVHATAMDHYESDRGGLGKLFQFLGFKRIQSVFAMDLGVSDEQR